MFFFEFSFVTKVERAKIKKGKITLRTDAHSSYPPKIHIDLYLTPNRRTSDYQSEKNL